ncbi:hypothetical protein [Actinomadura sediminis]|uniref:Uncharacterized protein n=1 Tax=Actinomadura sediminis TaxID=1038904 RepID=A0ABW3ES40_9ACTN
MTVTDRAPAGHTEADRKTVRCVECGTRGHPLQILQRSYCEHRTCMRGPCWNAHPRTCPTWLTATGGRRRPAEPVQTALPTPDAPAAPAPPAVQPALFDLETT